MQSPHQQHRLTVGLEAGFDPGWLAGLQYVRNIVYTVAALAPEERPDLRLLPVTTETVTRIRDLARYDRVEIAASTTAGKALLESRLWTRRFLRKYVQPRVGRPLLSAFDDLDVTYPGWGTPIPGVAQMHWVPDLQHVFLPEFFSPEEVARRDRDLERLASGTDTLIFSSHSALADFRGIFGDSTAPTHVWQFCSPVTDEELRGADPHQKYGVPTRYLYVANQFWAHKDHRTLFSALALLRDEGLRPVVVCTGLLADRRNPGYVDELTRLIRDENLADQVLILGVVPRPDQISILRHSTVVVQPSTFEGWSTVVEDAKAVGRPMILSDFRVHLEQAPDHVFFEMGSAESLADALRKHLPDLPEGPDPAAEASARTQLDERRRDLARFFVQIARAATDRESASTESPRPEHPSARG